MNDLKDLLELALSDGRGPDPSQPADPARDLARGRSLLRRRRLIRAAAGACVVTVAALVPLAWTAQHHGAAALPGRSSPAAAPSTSPASGRIALVAYTGQQIPGYQVSEVPRGWVIQGGNAYALVLAPKGDTDTSIDSFIGKLVVMLQSRDASSPSAGTRQPVDGRSGWFDVQGSTQILTYQDAKGDWVVIQAPASLGWDSARLAQFATGVQVLHNAQQGRG
jgi:hypothetical protein